MKSKLHIRNPKFYHNYTCVFTFFVFMFIGQSYTLAQNPNSHVDGGVISTNDNTTICIDSEPDPIYVTVEGDSGRLRQWIITDDNNNILALPDAPPFDLNGATPGVCRIWHLAYNGIPPFRHIDNLDDLRGRYDLSNYIEVTRNMSPEGGELAIAGSGDTEIEICAGDGESDSFDVTLDGAMGDNSLWVITDDNLNILATPASPPFDLEGAGAGICLIWHLSYADSVDLTGITNATDLMGCYSLSNPITVTRTEALSKFNLYPNPASSYISLKLPSNSDSYSISVYDLYNTPVLNKRVERRMTNKDVNLNLNSLNVGPYILVIVNETTGERTIKKLLKKN